MATYATKDDIEDLYGVDVLIRVADHNKDGMADEDVIAKGLLGADEICDAYLSARYSVPITPIPGIVRSCAIDISLYKMALGRAQRTDEMRVRYQDALALLEKIAKGTVGLGLPPADPDGDGVDNDPNAKMKGRSFDTGRA
jgi:phage gp36-like protein